MLNVLSITGRPPGNLGLARGTSPFVTFDVVVVLFRLFNVGPSWKSAFTGTLRLPVSFVGMRLIWAVGFSSST